MSGDSACYCISQRFDTVHCLSGGSMFEDDPESGEVGVEFDEVWKKDGLGVEDMCVLVDNR